MHLNFDEASTMRDVYSIEIPEEKRLNLIDIMTNFMETGVLDLEFSVPKPIDSLTQVQMEIAWQT